MSTRPRAGQVIGADTEVELERRLDTLASETDMTRDALATHFEECKTPVATWGRLRHQFAEMEALGITRFHLQAGHDPDTSPELLDAVSDSSR